MNPIEPAELKAILKKLKRLPKHGQLIMIVAMGAKRITPIKDILINDNDHAIFFETEYAILNYDRNKWFMGGREIQVLFGDDIAGLELS